MVLTSLLGDVDREWFIAEDRSDRIRVIDDRCLDLYSFRHRVVSPPPPLSTHSCQKGFVSSQYSGDTHFARMYADTFSGSFPHLSLKGTRKVWSSSTLTRAEPRVSAAKKLGRFSQRNCKSAFEPEAPQSL